MTSSNLRTAIQWAALVALFAALGFWTFAGAASKLPVRTISQKGRMFSIANLDISAGETIRIVNDDADLQHHVYVDSKIFSFDSSDQQPGSATDITFPVSGTFSVLCGIHPKMKLAVNVK